MKQGGLGRMVRRYLLSAAGIAVLLLILNAALILAFTAWQFPRQQETSRYHVQRIAGGLTNASGSFTLDEGAQELFNRRYEWALLLDADGSAVWSYNLPSEIPTRYTAAEIAQFSRWYLRDYPVNVWEYGEGGLLVLGSPKGSYVKYAEQFHSDTFDSLLWLPFAMLGLQVVAAIGLAVLFGRRMYRCMRPVAAAIADLAEQKPVSLSTGGMLGELSENLNRASGELKRQRAALEKRDQARTEWIAGISHDIRTPLSMVMGYASGLEEDAALPPEQRMHARVIRLQSQRIKELVENLNLISKLEYGWQPVERKPVALAALLRALVADYLNTGVDADCKLSLEIAEDTAAVRIDGDESLLRRAVRNLVDNSIRHNQPGCEIRISLQKDSAIMQLCVSDNGRGIPADKMQTIELGAAEHGLGLGIVQRVAQVHNSSMHIENVPSGGCRVVLLFPI